MKHIPRCLWTSSLCITLLTGCALPPTPPTPTQTVMGMPHAHFLNTGITHAEKGDMHTASLCFLTWWEKMDDKPIAIRYLRQLAVLYAGNPASEVLKDTLAKVTGNTD